MKLEIGQIAVISIENSLYSKLNIAPVNLLLAQKQNAWIVCQITGRTCEEWKTIEINSDDLLQGILNLSYAKIDKVFTIDESYFNHVVAQLKPAKTQEIKNAVLSCLSIASDLDLDSFLNTPESNAVH